MSVLHKKLSTCDWNISHCDQNNKDSKHCQGRLKVYAKWEEPVKGTFRGGQMYLEDRSFTNILDNQQNIHESFVKQCTMTVIKWIPEYFSNSVKYNFKMKNKKIKRTRTLTWTSEVEAESKAILRFWKENLRSLVEKQTVSHEAHCEKNHGLVLGAWLVKPDLDYSCRCSKPCRSQNAGLEKRHRCEWHNSVSAGHGCVNDKNTCCIPSLHHTKNTGTRRCPSGTHEGDPQWEIPSNNQVLNQLRVKVIKICCCDLFKGVILIDTSRW